MFSLIITVISIVLVSALALATVYYGGSAFNKNSTDAIASQYLLEGQQINGAVALAKAEGNYTDLASLVSGNYLTSIPGGWAASTPAPAYVVKSTTAAVCAAINAKTGTVAPATEADAAGLAGCTVTNVAFYRI